MSRWMTALVIVMAFAANAAADTVYVASPMLPYYVASPAVVPVVEGVPAPALAPIPAPVLAPPVVAAPVVVAPPAVAYYAPLPAYYYPAPVLAPGPVYYGGRYVVRTKFYPYGQPVRNVVRAVWP